MKTRHKNRTPKAWIKSECPKCKWYGRPHKVKSWKCIDCGHVWKG